MDPFHNVSGELRAVGTQVEQTRDMLERLERSHLTQAADLGTTLSRLTSILSRFEDGLRDIRLTMTGIGALAKSLAEKQQSHEEILQVVKDILLHLSQREPPHA